ncbi:MAG: hypothetical protein LBI39_02000 [Puniceicoccales bacterium]|jgi:hypothetical protein|nr:hypothetical protein [Puniceicoccales bacterium]
MHRLVSGPSTPNIDGECNGGMAVGVQGDKAGQPIGGNVSPTGFLELLDYFNIDYSNEVFGFNADQFEPNGRQSNDRPPTID